ncbi:MAG TPA: class I SAM-dependent methyltransferase [Acidimicrobiia bacterium]
MSDQGPFSATWPAQAKLSTDAIHYGPDLPTDDEFRLIGEVEGKRVLDLGCAVGHAAVALAERGAKVIGVDPSPERLARAREVADAHEVKIELHQSDLAELAYVRADSVDLVFSAYALATVHDLDRVFRQVHRVLRPDQHLVFSLPHPAYSLVDATSNDPLRIRRAYWDRTPRPFDTDDGPGADHPHTIQEIFTSLGRANFRVDTLLEPAPATDGKRSPYWSEIAQWVPTTLVVRARKEGI